jgi:hypothetical protein
MIFPFSSNGSLCLLTDLPTARGEACDAVPDLLSTASIPERHYVVTPPRGRSIPPKSLETIRRQRGVGNRVLDILMPKVVLDCAGVASIVGEFIAAGMAQHVGVNLEREAGLDAQPCDHPTKAADGECRAAFGHEHTPGLWRFLFEPA